MGCQQQTSCDVNVRACKALSMRASKDSSSVGCVMVTNQDEPQQPFKLSSHKIGCDKAYQPQLIANHEAEALIVLDAQQLVGLKAWGEMMRVCGAAHTSEPAAKSLDDCLHTVSPANAA